MLLCVYTVTWGLETMAKKKKRGGATDAPIDPNINSASTASKEPINGSLPVPDINTESSPSSLIICRNKYAESSWSI